MEQVSKELMDNIVKLYPKIEENNSIFNEQELVKIKAFFEIITGIKIGNMLNCGGKLCVDVRRSIVNYMASYKHVKVATPKNEAPKKEDAKPMDVKEKSPIDDKAKLMEKAIQLAKDKGIKKPHHLSGIDKLKDFIKENS